MAFLLTPPQADGLPWIFRADAKPFSVLISLFNHRHVIWQPSNSPSPSRRDRHKQQAEALTKPLIGMVAAFEVLIHSSPSTTTPTPGSLSGVQIEHFDHVFDKLVCTQVPLVVRTPWADTVRVGWSILANILQPRLSSDAPRPSLHSILLNPATLSTDTLSAKHAEPMVALALGAAAGVDEVKGWGAEWVSQRVGKVLALLSRCLGNWEAAASWELDVVEVSSRLWYMPGFRMATHDSSLLSSM